MSGVKLVKASRISSLDGFRGLNSPEREDKAVDWQEFSKASEIVVASKEELLITEGEKLECMIVILEGMIEIEGIHGEKTIHKITSPELYGESWLVHQKSSISIRVKSAKCTIVKLALDFELNELFTEDKPLKQSRGSLQSSGSPLRCDSNEEVGSFMKQLVAKRLPSNKKSSAYLQALQRKQLFYNIAAKLVYRLQSSITTFNASTQPQEDSSTATRKRVTNTSSLPTQALKRGHKRTPSNLVGKMFSRVTGVAPAIGYEEGKKKANDKASLKFIKRFRLPKTEKLMKECDASWVPENGQNPLDGKLFIGESFLCFLGNGFAFQTKTVTPLNAISGWKVVHNRLIFTVTSESMKYVYALRGDSTSVEELLSNIISNSSLLLSRPQSLARKESWVMEHHMDPVASESFNLQDCILLLDCSTRKVYKQGEIIIEQNSKQLELGMWKIASGRVKVVSPDGNILSLLGKNSFFGEISFFFPEVSSTASIVALDDVVEVFFLSGAQLNKHFEEYPNFGSRFYKYIATITAHRFDRYHQLFLSDCADYIYRQDVALVSTTIAHSETHMHNQEVPEEEFMVQLSKQFIKYFSSQGEAGKTSIADIIELKIDAGFLHVVTISSVITIQFSRFISEWYLAIANACSISYGLDLIPYEEKKILVQQVSVTATDCEIRMMNPSGGIKEQWFYNPRQGSIISLAFDRVTQCSWDGQVFTITNPKGYMSPGFGLWNGMEALWFPYEVYDASLEKEYPTREGADAYIYYNFVMTFEEERSSSSFTMHSTKLQKKNEENEFAKALRFMPKSIPKSDYIVADNDTPVPLLLFMYLAQYMFPSEDNCP